MVKAKQKNVRVFLFEESKSEEMIVYLRKNSILLRSYLLLFKGKLPKEVQECLKEEGLQFLEEFESKDEKNSANNENTKLNDAHKMLHANPTSPKEEHANPARIPTLILRRTIRSGEEVIALGDVSIFGRINSGARICAQGNVQIFGEIQGVVECEGEYMILGKISQGSVLFNGEILESSLFDGSLKEVYIHDNRVIVKELT